MKLALFSHYVHPQHKAKLETFFTKSFESVKFLYITTPTNDEPFQPEWDVDTEKQWRAIFPYFRHFDVERAFRFDKNFNFREHFSQFDFIFVSGGNTFLLNYWMKKSGAENSLKELILSDKVVYGGESAGIIYPSKNLREFTPIENVANAPEQINEGMDIVEFFALPHWESEEFHEGLKVINSKLETQNAKIYKLTNDNALFVNDKIIELI
jgi:hypothetical protein